jgi:hypothetical protein
MCAGEHGWETWKRARAEPEPAPSAPALRDSGPNSPRLRPGGPAELVGSQGFRYPTQPASVLQGAGGTSEKTESCRLGLRRQPEKTAINPTFPMS